MVVSVYREEAMKGGEKVAGRARYLRACQVSAYPDHRLDQRLAHDAFETTHVDSSDHQIHITWVALHQVGQRQDRGWEVDLNERKVKSGQRWRENSLFRDYIYILWE
jgi:hypothetical protein